MRPNTQTPSRSAGLVLFALGLARVPPKAPLPGPVLVAILAELGMSEPAARSTILRLRRSGWLTSQRCGRIVGYAPSAAVVAGHRRRAEQFPMSQQRWDGKFHALLVTVPETQRAFRDHLRRTVTIAGYKMLRPGLFIAANERLAELTFLLDRAPAGARVTLAHLELGLADARQVASELWSLDELAARYRQAAARAREASEQAADEAPVAAAALRGFAAAALPIYAAIADDPALPQVLLPVPWPSAELGLALKGVLKSFMPAVGEHIDQLLGDGRHRPA